MEIEDSPKAARKLLQSNKDICILKGKKRLYASKPEDEAAEQI